MTGGPRLVMKSTLSITAFYTCNSGDQFKDIWTNVLEEIRWVTESKGPGFVPELQQQVRSAGELLANREPTPHDVRRVLQMLTSTGGAVAVFIDEFDRPQDENARRLMADTIKILSDEGIDATLVLIGVATAVNDLITEHLSIGRALAQVQMPLMSEVELAKIVTTGMANAELEVDPTFTRRVVELSQGLPHFTHLIAQHGARAAVEDHRARVADADTKDAVRRSIADVSQSIREAYHRATYSNRDTLYRDVLLACAMARKNTLGQFDSRAVVEVLNTITKRRFAIPAISGHLSAFSDPEHARGGVLDKLGTRARYDYRFIDPLMPPYVLMQGHADDTI